jgi:hypothetical protein
MRLNYPVIFPLNQLTYVGEDDSKFFCQIHGRRFNALSSRYMLPADEEEVRVRLFPHATWHRCNKLVPIPAIRTSAQDDTISLQWKELCWSHC